MALTLVTAPPVTPLSLTEVKEHLRVDGTDQDNIIQHYLDAATSYLDGEWGKLGRALVTQTWRLTIDEFPDGEIRIPLPPLQSITDIRYDDSAGDEQLVSTDDYWVDTSSEPGWVVPTTSGGWPTTLDAVNAVRIQFVAGYEATSDSPPDYTANIPADTKQGMLLIIGDWMENRRNVMENTINTIPFAAEILLLRKKIDLGFA